MLKVAPHPDYPPEDGRYVRGNNYRLGLPRALFLRMRTSSNWGKFPQAEKPAEREKTRLRYVT